MLDFKVDQETIEGILFITINPSLFKTLCQLVLKYYLHVGMTEDATGL